MKKIITVVSILTLSIGLITAGALSARVPESDGGTAALPASGEKGDRVRITGGAGSPLDLTEEELAEFEQKMSERRAEMEEMSEKWAALSDDEKSEIYAIMEEMKALQKELVQKYVDLGLVSPETAEFMTPRDSTEESGDKIPFLLGGGKVEIHKFDRDTLPAPLDLPDTSEIE